MADEEYLKAKGAAVIDTKVYPQNQWAWGAYQALRGSRAVGMSIGPIPLSEVLAYCDLAGINDRMQRMRLARFVLALDAVELKHHGDTTPKR